MSSIINTAKWYVDEGEKRFETNVLSKTTKFLPSLTGGENPGPVYSQID